MGEYGVAESWSKNHVFSLFSGIAPFGFTSNNEFLFEACGNRLALYDSVAAKVKLSEIEARLMDYTKIVQYVDSLVWIGPAQCEIPTSLCKKDNFLL